MHEVVDVFSRGRVLRLCALHSLPALMVLSGALFASPVAAQGLIATASANRSAPIAFASGADGENGFLRAGATLEYRFTACRGAGPAAIMISWRVSPGSLSAGNEYRYGGKTHTVRATPSVRAIPLAGTAHSNGRQIGSVNHHEALEINRITADCNTPGLNYAPIADLEPFADPTNPAAVAAFLNTLTFTPAAAPTPLRDFDLEQRIRTEMRRAEDEAANREREEAQAQAEAEERQRREAAQPTTSGASASGSDSSPTSTSSPEEAARAEEARRQEEAQRVAEQVRRQMAEEQRRQKERESGMVNAATGGARAAMATGLGFGGYYFGMSGGISSIDTFDNLQGFGMGFDAKFMYLDVGVLSGAYTEGFREDYESDGYSTLSDMAVTGYFGNAGVMWMMVKEEAMQLGFSGGLLYAVTPEADMYTPVMGFVGRFGGLALRFDMSGEGSLGGAIYFNVGG